MRLSFHLPLLCLALLCPIPRTITSYPHSHTLLLPTVDRPKLESTLLHLQAALEDPMDNRLVHPEAWGEWPQDTQPALSNPREEEEEEEEDEEEAEEDEEDEEEEKDGSWEEEVLRRAQRGDLMAWPLSPFPGGHSLESLYYQEGGEGEDGLKRNDALTSIAGGLQAVSREKGGFGFRFGRKRWNDGG